MIIHGLKKISRSVKWGLKGFHQAYRRDESFRLEINWGAPVYLLFLVLVSPLSTTEFLFVVLSYVLILSTELMNTAFERMLERVHPEEHELIGVSKDIGSAAVLVTFFFAIIVTLSILIPRIW